jgi:hypothetical protein
MQIKVGETIRVIKDGAVIMVGAIQKKIIMDGATPKETTMAGDIQIITIMDGDLLYCKNKSNFKLC